MNDWKSEENRAPSLAPQSEAELEELLRAAGPRPVPPAEDLAAIRSVARDEWRRVVRPEGGEARAPRWPRALAMAAGLLLALGAAWWWTSRAPTLVAPGAATWELASGDVRVLGAAAELPAPGETLPVGAIVETRPGAESRAALRLSGGQSVRLSAATRVVLAAADRLELARGTLYVDSGAGAAAVEVVTSFGVVRDIGTQFEVHMDGEDSAVLRVRVREGAISLSNGGTHEAAAGEELRLEAGGKLSRATVPRTGAIWDWVQRAAPGLDIEGLTLTAYLDWVGRETGWEVDFSSGTLEESAAAVRLHGTIEGLTPEESLSVILPGSGFAWAVEDGRLVLAER